MTKHLNASKPAGESWLTRWGVVVGIFIGAFTIGTAAGGFAFNSSQNAQLVRANSDLQAKLDKTTSDLQDKLDKATSALQAKLDKANADLQSANAALEKANAKADDHAAYEADIARLQARADALDKQLTPEALKAYYDTLGDQQLPASVMKTREVAQLRDEVSKELIAKMGKCSD
jgi:chromosome segregation ATPase